MHKFDEIKCSLKSSVENLIENIIGIHSIIDAKYNGNPILKCKLDVEKLRAMKQLSNTLTTHLDMICRTKMKCVFFGKTSNGKSAVINAMLGSEVLPSCIGRTTSCFITVEGCYDEEGYFLDVNKAERSIDDLEDVASEFEENSIGIDSGIDLFWPITKCDLLQYEVQLLDSPGCDVSNNNDSWIDKYCQDADVFVYVVDATSTICETEREFFRKVKSKVGNPNLFVLLNKWDICQTNNAGEKLERIRRQHLNTISLFFENDMEIHCIQDQRIFFVSATDSLKGLSPEFEEFVNSFTLVMTHQAIKSKFKQHCQKSADVTSTVVQLVDFITNLKKKRDDDPVNDIEDQITEIFRITEKNSLRAMRRACEDFVLTISANIQRGCSSIDTISILIESQFKELILALQNNVGTILSMVREQLSQSACVFVNAHIMDQYLPQSFEELINKYKAKLSKKQMNSEIPDAFNDLSDYLRTGNSTTSWDDTPFKDVPILGLGIFAVKSIFSIISNAVSDICSAVTNQVTKTDKKAELERLLNDRIYNYLSKTVTQIINKSQRDIRERISLEKTIFSNDCAEIDELIQRLIEIKWQLDSISDDLSLTQVRISSLDD